MRGFLADTNYGKITASYATGRVTGGAGLVGDSIPATASPGTVTASYWDSRTSGHTSGTYGSPRRTSQLQSPTSYSGIYGSWNVDVDAEEGSDNPWAFGTSSQYPALKSVVGDDQAMWQEFGYQLREGPSLTASTTPGMAQVALSWTAPVVSHWIPAPSVTYTLTRDDGTTLETLATDLSSLQYTDTGVTPGATYTYQLAASVSGGEATRSARVSATVPSTSAPSVSSIAITSVGGYAAGETIEVTVTFTKAVAVTGSPQLTLNVGGEDRTAGYESVTGAAVVFSYTVAVGESDRNGVSIEANSLSLNVGTIRDSMDNTDAVLNHRALAASGGHRVDGIRPELLSTGGAVVNGATLTADLRLVARPDVGSAGERFHGRRRQFLQNGLRGCVVQFEPVLGPISGDADPHPCGGAWGDGITCELHGADGDGGESDSGQCGQ